jgi:hypothetical protein
MSTPDMVSEMAKSACVTWRAQPPFWIRFGALLKEAQNIGMSPTSVGGGDWAEGNWLAIAGLLGPGSVRLAGFFAFIAPCGGSSGLPNVAGSALAAVTMALVAVATNISRLDIIAHSFY